MSDFTYSVQDWGGRPESNYSLSHDALVRSNGSEQTRLAFEDIVEIQLALSPGFPSTARRCRLVDQNGNTMTILGQHYVESDNGLAAAQTTAGRMLALMQHLLYREDRSKTFRPFVAELLRRVVAINPKARFVAGSTRGWLIATLLFGICGGFVFLFAIPVFTAGKFAALAPMTVFGSLMPWFWPVVSAGPSRALDPHDPPLKLLTSASGTEQRSEL